MDELTTTDLQDLLPGIFDACGEAGAILREHFRSSELSPDTKDDGTPVTVADRGAEAVLRQRLGSLCPDFGFLGEELGASGNQRVRWVLDPIDGTRNFVDGLPWFATLIALQDDDDTVLSVIHAPVLGSAGSLGGADPGASEDIAGWTWWAVRGGGAFGAPGLPATPEDRRARRLAVSATSQLSDTFLTHGGVRHLYTTGEWEQFTRLIGEVRRTRSFGDWWGHVLVAEGRVDATIDVGIELYDIAAPGLLVQEAGGAVTMQPSSVGSKLRALTSNASVHDPVLRTLGW
ncbi:MAG: inositol monophosphatase family protein [Acidobacteriota bacterium]